MKNLMKFFYSVFITLTLLFAFQVSAQFGTTGAGQFPPEPSQGSAGSAATPAPVPPPQPASTNPAPVPASTPVPKPTPKPKPKTSPVVLPMAIDNIPNTPPITSSSGGSQNVIIGTLVAAGLAGLAFFGLKLKKNKNEEKDDSKKCLNFKKLMEEKLKELTDLNGQLKDMAKEKGMEQVGKILAGTTEGKIIEQVSNAKKEYERLKNLYEKCIADLNKNYKRLSYLMGRDNIQEEDLKKLNIKIEGKSPNGHLMIKIPEDKLSNYIELVKKKLNNGFWNEVVGEKEIIFIFKFKDAHIEEYKLSPENEDKIDRLCAEFNGEEGEETSNVYRWLANNKFYHDFMSKNYDEMINR